MLKINLIFCFSSTFNIKNNARDLINVSHEPSLKTLNFILMLSHEAGTNQYHGERLEIGGRNYINRANFLLDFLAKYQFV